MAEVRARAPAGASNHSSGDSAVEMPWLISQHNALLQQKGHALLLQGPSGLGQFELALMLAQAWLCESRPLDAAYAPACGHCHSCHAIKVHTHPDLLVLMPEVQQLALGWASPDMEAATASESGAKRKPSREIRIDAMRQMITFSQRTDSRGRGKVVIVYPAEDMNHITANALLKTLEEPPGGTRFILASDAAHRLLPTIRSRCHTWALQWPQPAQSQQWLQASSVAEDQASVFLQMAGDRPQDALELARSGLKAADWAALPQALKQGQAGLLAGLPPSEVIRILQKICHDLLSLMLGAAPRYFPAQSLGKLVPAVLLVHAETSATAPAALAPQVQAAIEQLQKWYQALTQASRTSEHPFSADLMVTALVEQARNAINFRV